MDFSTSQGTPSGHQFCPSLHAATTLARLVLQVKQRFKARLKSPMLPTKPLVIYHDDHFNARILSGAKHAVEALRKGNVCLPYRKSTQVQVEERGIPTLLQDLDTHTSAGGAPISMTAQKEELFLKHDSQKMAKAMNVVGLRRIFGLTTLLLDRLQHLTHATMDENDDTSWIDSACSKTMANLEHLLRCLQQATLDALISDMLKSMEPEVARWQQYWQQRRAVLHGWFSEWPNGQPPLNTTMPWNVKPSLVVLWGVCWMFFEGDDAWMTHKPPPPQSQTMEWQPEQVATSQLENSWESNQSWLLPASLETLVQSTLEPGVANSWYETRRPIIDAITGAENQRPFEINWFLDSDLVRSGSSLDNRDLPTNQPSYHNSETLSQTIGARPELESYNQQEQPSRTERRCQPGSGLMAPTLDLTHRRSPHSEISGSGLSPCPSTNRDTSLMPDVASSSADESPSPRREKHAIVADPVINERGSYQCPHPKCASEPQEFSRKCEWIKHRDKHNRPHVCKQPGCEKIQGFTYAGGLLRHEREVHRQHGGPKASYMCPHSTCKRSSGTGFSRKENLMEHLRRVHRKLDGEGDPAALVKEADFRSSTFLPGLGKRRRGDDSDEESEEGSDQRDLAEQVKEMKKGLENADKRLKRLEQIVEKLSAGLIAAATS